MAEKAYNYGMTHSETSGSLKRCVDRLYLNGYLCKRPKFRKTPKGIFVADVMLAVNNTLDRSAYIPCICFYDNALYADECMVGDNIILKGRIQNREYYKRLSSGIYETRVAYEVAASKIERAEEKQDIIIS